MATFMPGGYAVSGIPSNPLGRAVQAAPAVGLQGDLEIVGGYSLLGTVAEALNTPPIVHRVRLFDAVSWRWLRTTFSTLTGAWAFHDLAYKLAGYAVVVEDAHVPPLQPLIYSRLTPTLPNGEPIPLVFTNGQIISGTATQVDGTPADLVAFRVWETKAWLANVTPGPGGAWSILLPNGVYDVTYFAAGCQPICHGPYTITG